MMIINNEEKEEMVEIDTEDEHTYACATRMLECSACV